MNCPNCRQENAPGARFCNNCGNPLSEQPGGPLTAGAATRELNRPGGVGQYPAASGLIPAELAAKLQAARASRAMVGERRVVTMLFCDVKGSTAAAEQLDPEEWTDIMNGAFEHMIRPIYDYEGTVTRLMGDAVLAFFGAPIAHEDDPERAVRAGLEIVEAIQPYRAVVRRDWRIDFDVRVGINTGLVVVGPVGSDLRMEYTALGDAINLAARMEQTAAPGTVQIAEPTHKLVAPLFEVEALGGLPVKGKTEPVAAYRVLRRKLERGRLRGIEGLDSPMVGRDSEMAALAGALDELHHGRGRIVSIIGEAGLGKSRLMAELRARTWSAAGGAPERQWLEGRCLSYQTTTPYAPFIDLFFGHFGLRDAPAEANHYQRLAQQVAAAGTDRASEIAPFLATLLDISLSGEAYDQVRYQEPAQLNSRIQEAVQDYLKLLAVNAPVVLTIDDLHWSDPTSLDLLESLLPLAEQSRIMIVAVSRPQAQETAGRIHEIAGRDFARHYLALTLKPLDDGHSRELVANLLHVEGLPATARQLILDKAEGNPFFVEEVIRSLLDSGLVVNEQGRWRATKAIENIAVPDTLAAVINTRLDQLDDDTRSVLQSAAVIGRQFSLALLKALHPHHLNLAGALTELQQRELVREKEPIPERTYNFKHALTQEAAYNSLLLKTRREMHLRAARAIETVYASTLQAHTPELAHHAYQAGLWPEALRYSWAAGEHALRLYAPRAALEHLTHALDAAGRLDQPVPAALFLARAQAHQLIGVFEPALADLEAGLQAARAAGEQRVQWEALLAIGLLWTSRDYGEAERQLRRALELARTLDDARAIGHTLNRLGSYLTNLERPDEALAYHQEALQRFEQLQDQRGLAETHDLTATALGASGDWASAAAHYRQAEPLFRALDDRQGLASCLTMSGFRGGAYLNDAAEAPDAPHAAQRDTQAALDLARQTGQRGSEAMALSALAICLGPQGEYARALDLARQGLAVAKEINHRHWTCFGQLALGALFLDLLAGSAALEQLQQAQALAADLGSLFFSRLAGAYLISAHTLSSQLEQAQAVFDSTVDAAAPARSAMQRQVWAARSELALAQAKPELALQIVEQLSATSVRRPASGEVSIPRLAWLRGRALLGLRRPGEAEAELLAAESSAAAHGFRGVRWRILADLARAHLSQGHGEAAAAALGAARSSFESLAAPLPEVGLRQQFIERALAGLPAAA